MVATNEDRQVWCSPDAAVVLVKVAYLPIFDRNRHAIQIIGVSDCLALLPSGRNEMLEFDSMSTYLKVTADNQDIYTIPAIELTSFLNGRVDGVECSMTLIQFINTVLLQRLTGRLTQPSTAIRKPCRSTRRASSICETRVGKINGDDDGFVLSR